MKIKKNKQLSLLDKLLIPTYDSPGHMQMGDLAIDPEKCRQCGTCIKVCPGGCLKSDSVIKMDYFKNGAKGKTGLPYLDTMPSGVTLCVACFDCGAACPHGAISLIRNFMAGFFYKRLTQEEKLTCPKPY
jgi:ferredoxin